MEAKYIYLTSFAFVLMFVLIPLVLFDINGGNLEDIEPYGVFALTSNVANWVVDFIGSIFKVFIPSDGIDDKIDEIIESFSNFTITASKIYTLIPISVYIIMFVPLLITSGYALIKALPTT